MSEVGKGSNFGFSAKSGKSGQIGQIGQIGSKLGVLGGVLGGGQIWPRGGFCAGTGKPDFW
jgi:hypothetical protein